MESTTDMMSKIPLFDRGNCQLQKTLFSAYYPLAMHFGQRGILAQ